MAAENEITFTIEGDDKTYTIPGVDEFDFEEFRILWDYTGLVLEDFVPPLKDDDGNVLDEEAETERLRRINQPGFLMARCHIAYRRAHPDLNDDHIKKVLGRANFVEIWGQIIEQAVEQIKRDGADDDGPPASAIEPEPSSPSSSIESDANETPNSEPQSPISANGSDEPGNVPSTTTTGV